MFIDTHCHIYLPEFDDDRVAMVQRAEEEGVKKFLMPAIDSSTHKVMLDIGNEFSGKAYPMMGLHPCSIKENYQEELLIINEYLSKQKFIAIGEIGLDFYWDLAFTQQQYDAFHLQIGWALLNDYPIVIHSRNSLDECIKVIEKNQNGNLHGVFHCFSGNLQQAKKIIELDFYLGIGGVLTFKNSGLDKVMEHLPLDHVVLETDAPYLAPVPFRGKRNECSYIKYIAEKLAGIKSMSVEDVAMITTSNAEKLFGANM